MGTGTMLNFKIPHELIAPLTLPSPRVQGERV